LGLRLADKWLWDFWLARDGPDYHLFYLQAPRSLEHESLRHWNASIGHAVSQDLLSWEVLPDALHPGAPGAWDDYSTWTGSVIRHGGLWYLFYTSLSRAEDGRVQRIGAATSEDLIAWERRPENPLITADPEWYELPDRDGGRGQSWRDPWVFRHPETGEFHAYITARVKHGPLDGRGVIAHARSADLIRWEVLPPVTEPGFFYDMEVSQLVELRGRYYLLFCSPASWHSALRRAQTGLEPVTGTHYLVAEGPLGPFRYSTHEFLSGDPVGLHYAGKLVQGPDGGCLFLAWRNFAPDGSFLGDLIDPIPVEVDAQGDLRLERR
jgi:beta-fructofuranosidase